MVRKNLVVYGCIILFLLSPLTITYAQDNRITMKEFLEDRDIVTGNFTTYDPGDTVEVYDTIAYVRYLVDKDISQVWLLSTGDGIYDFNLTFIGNLKDDFKPGDKIKLKLHIVCSESGEWFKCSRTDLTLIEEKKVPVTVEKGLSILGFRLPLPEQLDNNIGHFVLYVIIWIIIAYIIYFLLSPVIKHFAKKTKTEIDDIIIDIIKTPVLILVALFGTLQSLTALGISYELYIIVTNIYNLGVILVIFYLGYKIYKQVLIYLGHKMAKKVKPELSHTLLPVIEKVGSIIILLLAIMYISRYAGWDMTGFLAGAGIIGLVIAFAAQETLGNFFAGVFLILDPRFKVGDEIEMDGNYYRVTKIGMRTTELYDLFHHITVIMPNSHIANSKITILTEPDRKIKTSINFSVAYGTDPKRVEKLALDLAKNHPDVINREGYYPIVRFTEMADSSLNFKLIVWVNDLDDMWRVRSELTEMLYTKLTEEGIEIPFPQRTIWIRKEE